MPYLGKSTRATPDKKQHKKNAPKKQESIRNWLDTTNDPIHAERSMWVAVITQAMMDALSRSRKAEEQFNKFEATRWLTGNSSDFRNVCLMAGMDPDYVRARAQKAITQNTKWRAEAGCGKRYEERKAYREKLRHTLPPVMILLPTSPLPHLMTTAAYESLPA